MYRKLRLCSDRGGYEAIAEPAHPIDLVGAKARLLSERIPVIDARVILIVTLDSEVTISRTGRLLFKTPDAGEAEHAFVRLRALLGLPEMEGVSGARPPGG